MTVVSVGKTDKGDENDGGCEQIETSVVMVKLDHFRDSTLFCVLLFFTIYNFNKPSPKKRVNQQKVVYLIL